MAFGQRSRPLASCILKTPTIYQKNTPFLKLNLSKGSKNSSKGVVMSSSNGRKSLIYRPKGGLCGLRPPMPRGEQWEVTIDARSPREVRKIKILQKTEPVQRRQDHLALSGSHTPARSTLTRPGTAEQSRTGPSRRLDRTGRNSHLPH
jgi:hypothetical protein